MAVVSVSITRYPADHGFVLSGVTGSLGLHLLAGGLILWIAFLTHIQSIQQLMAEGGSIAQSGPAPETLMEVWLQPQDLPPPPPTPAPEFIRQVELPQPAVFPPPPVPVKAPPKPAPVAKPRFTAPHATGTGESASISRLVVGSSGFPQPPYPYAAQMRGESGTVGVAIAFDGAGRVADIDVTESSGVAILDASTRSFIRSNWHNESFAGQRVTVPIVYQLD